ncbi:hypothetical protein [Brevibacillus reuszeri]|uniref:hypothetical protein n=1 Tax=Brevibacillus reuszeri TaxID=54915 RepID=UPI0028A075A5|nr:hypothetical protein [Brevibacillus reuszeri]
MDSLDKALPEVSVIIPAGDESSSIIQTIQMARKLSSALEVIVVCPGQKTYTTQKARILGAQVVHSHSVITYDEGRSLGAMYAKGETLLFLDERVRATSVLLNRIIDATNKGWDVVLTAYTPASSKSKPSSQRMAARFLNCISGKTELGAASLCFVPYALKQRAIERLGHQLLRTPPLALAFAGKAGLSITSIPSKTPLKWNKEADRTMHKQTQVILQEHAEAIRFLLQEKGQRAGLPDGDRFRILLQAPGLLHLRSVFYQEPSEREGNGWGAKRKAKCSPHKKAGSRAHKKFRKK